MDLKLTDFTAQKSDLFITRKQRIEKKQLRRTFVPTLVNVEGSRFILDRVERMPLTGKKYYYKEKTPNPKKRVLVFW